MWVLGAKPLLEVDTSWGLFRILKWVLIVAVIVSVLRPAIPLAPREPVGCVATRANVLP